MTTHALKNIFVRIHVQLEQFGKKLPQRQERKVEKLEEPMEGRQWLKENWLVVLGAILILVAFIWFVVYGLINGWIGATLLVIMGFSFALLLVLAGYSLANRFPGLGQVLMVMGGFGVIFTSFGALVDLLFTEVVAYLPMLAGFLLMAGLALYHRSRGMMHMALLAGLLIPALLLIDLPNYLLLMVHVFLVSIFALKVASAYQWRGLSLMALAGGIFYSLYSVEIWTELYSQLLAAVFFIVFLGWSTASVLVRQKGGAIDILISIFNSLFIILSMAAFEAQDWQMLIFGAVALLLILSGYWLTESKQKPIIPLLNLIFAILILAIINAVQTQEVAMMSMLYALQAVGLVFVLAYGFKSQKLASWFSLFGWIPFGFAVYHLVELNNASTLVNVHLFAVLAIVSSLGATGFILEKKKGQPLSSTMRILNGLMATFHALVLFWVGAAVLLDSANLARAISLIFYSIVGILVFFWGRNRDSKLHLITGGVLLGLVVLRLLLIEVWIMPVEGRIITFFIVGALLVSTAFFRKKILR